MKINVKNVVMALLMLLSFSGWPRPILWLIGHTKNDFIIYINLKLY